MDSDLSKLSYRELAYRPVVSADAARLKPKKKTKAGLGASSLTTIQATKCFLYCQRANFFGALCGNV